MNDPSSFEYLAMEAERHAETANSALVAQGWRDIARGYRLLNEFVAREREAAPRSETGAATPELVEHRGWHMGRRSSGW